MLPVVSTQSLPGMVQRAAQQLASATSAAEVLDARDLAAVAYDAAKAAARFARAKGAADELIAKAHRAQADALEIEALAKRRLADEYDAAQERGEVASHGGDRKINLPDAKVENINLSYREVHEARQIRDAEEAHPGIVRETLNAALDAGEEPTKAALNRAVGGRHRRLSPAGRQLTRLRDAWRSACPAVRQQFLAEIGERLAA